MIDVAKINPKNGNKFSPNLYKFIKAKKCRLLYKIYKDARGAFYIGTVDNDYGDGIWFTGTLLMRVLCLGRGADTYARAIAKNDFVEVVDFWDDYYKYGRCAVDIDHTGSFMGDNGRWIQFGDKRECTWCGNFSQVLRRWTVEVEKSEWVTSAVQRPAAA
jgi:hypothetical protein